MTLAQAQKFDEASALHAALQSILDIHRQHFAEAQHPIAGPAQAVDEAAIHARHRAASIEGVGMFQFAEKKARRARAAVIADEEVRQQREAAVQALAAHQLVLDEWWAELCANDPGTVTGMIDQAFEDNEAMAACIDVTGSEAELVVLVPDESAVPLRKPDTTPGGRITTKAMTKKERDAFYTLMVCGYVLVTVRECLAVAPAIATVRIVAVRDAGTDAYGSRRSDAILAATFTRSALLGVRWDTADSGTIVQDASSELLANYKGVNRVLSPIDLTKEKDLAALVEAFSFE